MTTSTRQIPLRRICDHVIELAMVASLVVILYVTLFPFDFRFSPVRQMLAEIGSRFDMRPTLALRDDIENNILLFLPLGFCIAALAFARMRTASVLALTTLCGGAISGMVEILQVFLGRRCSQINDVLANALGALVGALVLLAIRRVLVIAGHWLVGRTEPLVGPRIRWIALGAVVLAWVGWLGINTYMPIRLYHAGWLMFWDRSYPLNVGNETSGDRPWEGTVRRLTLASRAISRAEAQSLARTGRTEDVPRGDLLFDFDLDPTRSPLNARLADRLDPNRRLRWSEPPPAPLRADGSYVGSQAFLSCENMPDVIARVIDSDQFTFYVDAASASPGQSGQCRIASISSDPRARNLMVGQDGRTLIARIRFPLTGANGSDPELLVDDVFTDSQPRRIVVSYSNSVVRISVNGPSPRTEELVMVPELAVMWRLFPRSGWAFRLGTSGVPVYQVLYRIMVFGTLGAGLCIAIMLVKPSPRARRFVLLAGWLVPVIIIESIHSWVGSGFDAGPAVLSLVIGMAGSVLGWLWMRRLGGRSTADGATTATTTASHSGGQ